MECNVFGLCREWLQLAEEEWSQPLQMQNILCLTTLKNKQTNTHKSTLFPSQPAEPERLAAGAGKCRKPDFP